MTRSNRDNAQAGDTIAEYGKGWSGRGSLRDLVAELQRQTDSKHDFVADQRTLRFDYMDGDTGPALAAGDAQVGEWLTDTTPFSDDALTQFGERMDPSIPRKFLRAAIETHPAQFRQYVNDTIERSPKRNLIRCLDGRVRAILSDSYRCIDNYDVANEAMMAVRDNGGEVVEATLTDRYMRIKFTSRDIYDVLDTTREGDKRDWYAGGLGNKDHLSKVAARTTGDLPGGPGTVHPLITITNSETGFGRYEVSIGILQAICFNLATVEQSVARVHLGSKLETGIFSAETIAAESNAIFSKARDVIHAAFDVRKFKGLCDKVRASTEAVIEAPGDAVDNIIRVADGAISADQRDDLLAYFCSDYAPTAYGLAQAASRLAQDVGNADTAADIEAVAGKVMTAPQLVVA